MASSTLPVPADFVTHYNGYTFPPEDTLTTSLKITPVESPDGRTVMYNRITIGLRTVIAGQPTDAAAMKIRHKLTKYGGVLIYGGRGLGPLVINTGKVRDVNYGPKPREVGVKLLGGRNAFQLDWQVETCLPECPDAKYQFATMALTYTVEHQLRRNGRVNRVVTGELLIPNNRQRPGSYDVLDNPDQYRDKLVPPLSYNFHREFQPFRVNAARTGLTFGWTDKEFDRNIFPPGIVALESSQTVRSDSPSGVVFAKFMAMITANYTLAADADPITAVKHFFKVIVKDRLTDRRNKFKVRGTAVTFLPMSFEATDPNSFGDETVCRFQFGYKILNTTLAEILQHSGMWERYDPKDREKKWKDWAFSLQNSALDPKGFSNLTFTVKEDEIIDLCRGDMDMSSGGKGYDSANLRLAGIDPPSPENSWLDYKNSFRVESDTGVVTSTPVHSKQTVDSPTSSAPKGSSLTGTKSAESTTITRPPDMEKPADYGAIAGPQPMETAIVDRSGPQVVVYYEGSAIRAGYQIPCPELKAVDGITMTLANRLDKGEGFQTAIIARTNVPIYGARWKLRYVFSKMPKNGIPVPPDPTNPGG